jgi:hypothetical protein
MLKFSLMLAALLIAATPAALGLIRNASFTPETPVQSPERSIIQLPPERQQSDPERDERKAGKEAGKEDGDSGRAHGR